MRRILPLAAGALVAATLTAGCNSASGQELQGTQASPSQDAEQASEYPDKPHVGKYLDGEEAGFEEGNTCLVPVAEVAHATGLDLVNQNNADYDCNYTLLEPT